MSILMRKYICMGKIPTHKGCRFFESTCLGHYVWSLGLECIYHNSIRGIYIDLRNELFRLGIRKFNAKYKLIDIPDMEIPQTHPHNYVETCSKFAAKDHGRILCKSYKVARYKQRQESAAIEYNKWYKRFGRILERIIPS